MFMLSYVKFNVNNAGKTALFQLLFGPRLTYDYDRILLVLVNILPVPYKESVISQDGTETKIQFACHICNSQFMGVNTTAK